MMLKERALYFNQYFNHVPKCLEISASRMAKDAIIPKRQITRPSTSMSVIRTQIFDKRSIATVTQKQNRRL